MSCSTPSLRASASVPCALSRATPSGISSTSTSSSISPVRPADSRAPSTAAPSACSSQPRTCLRCGADGRRQGHHIPSVRDPVPHCSYCARNLFGLWYSGAGFYISDPWISSSSTLLHRRTTLGGTMRQSRLARWPLIPGSLYGLLHGGVFNPRNRALRLLQLNLMGFARTRFRREANQADNKAATIAVDSLINYEAVKVRFP